MGLTKSSTGGTLRCGGGILPEDIRNSEKIIALAGNPNVGKSTVFNALTGMNQHTGNWPGKTVESAVGRFCTGERRAKKRDAAYSGTVREYILVDLPGTYSLSTRSSEEEVARDFICGGEADAVVVVCDAGCLVRNLGLALQTLELTGNVIVCVNLMDEAERKGIHVDTAKISERLGVPVVGTVARDKSSLRALTDAIDSISTSPPRPPRRIAEYPAASDDESEDERNDRIAGSIIAAAEDICRGALTQTDNDTQSRKSCYCGAESHPCGAGCVKTGCCGCQKQSCGTGEVSSYTSFDRKLDRIFTGKYTAYPVMLGILALVFWLTISGANYVSDFLSDVLSALGRVLSDIFLHLGAPQLVHDILIDGAYRVLAWVVSVMLPPMAIFFPLFTLMEDCGLLPRIAYNLDGSLAKCSSCGKQALTVCMGFGCNAAGVVGCRIIDSPRERLLAILTNSFVPCNGRFPALIAMISMFIASDGGAVVSAPVLTAVIVLSVAASLGATKLLSLTLLRGMPSALILELPPYRRPEIGKVLVRSIFDRTLFVLGRAAAVAAPAGVVIWCFSNITVGGESIMTLAASFLDPLGAIMGLDGVILIAFILGFPANEIVLPIIITAYSSSGVLTETGSLSAMKDVLLANGWTTATAVSMIIFMLMHWPCSTTLMTVKKETGKLRWTLLAAALPALVGFALCVLFTLAMRMLGLE